ncbi:MAG: hypothetical protein LKM31_07040 [Sphingobium sp.]|jgi:hypothetical protein|nr:hypothetical protein [Sphingobium sp.]
MADFKNYIGEDDWPKNPRAIGDMILAAGMARSDKKRVNINGDQETILITQPTIYSSDLLKMMQSADIVNIIVRGRTAFYN